MISRGIVNGRVVPIVLVSVMLLFAGCSALGNDDSSSPAPDQSQQAIPTVEASDSPPTARPDDQANAPPLGAFPEGTSAQGITDPVAVIAEHLEVLSDSSYTVERSEAHTAADYTYSMRSTLAVDGDRQRLFVDYEGQSQDVYRADNASPSYIRWESANASRYLRDEGDVLLPGESAFFTQSVLEASTLELVEGRTVDGHDVFVFAITDFEQTPNLRDATPLEDVQNLRGTVSVRGDGVIAGFDIELAGHDFDGLETTLRIAESFSAIGTTTVAEPDWLTEAQDRAALMVAELDPAGAYVAISMEHGDPIPPGSTGYLYVGEIALETPFKEGMETGQLFYLYESTAGELAVSMTPPADSEIGASVPDDLQEVSVAIFHADYGTVFASTLTIRTDEGEA